MSRSDEALQKLESAAAEVLDCAKASLGGVGMACFITAREQHNAFESAEAKLRDATAIVEMVRRFKVQHGAFK